MRLVRGQYVSMGSGTAGPKAGSLTEQFGAVPNQLRHGVYEVQFIPIPQYFHV